MESQDLFVRRWVLVALVYFVCAVSLGVFMSAAHDFRLRGVHVHVNMLGWVSMALTALIYRLFPAAGATLWARVHFWLYNATLPVMVVSLGRLLLGDARFVPGVAAGAVVLLISIVIFAVTVFRHSSPAVSPPVPQRADEFGLWNAA